MYETVVLSVNLFSSIVSNICSELGIPDLNNHDAPASHIKQAILHHHDKHIIEELMPTAGTNKQVSVGKRLTFQYRNAAHR